MTTPSGNPVHERGEHWPILTATERLRFLANMIRTADHPHDSRADALKCVLARVHEGTITDAIHTALFGGDPECYHAAKSMACSLLDGAQMNVRMLIMLGEVAGYYLAETTDEPVPAILDNALMEA